MMKYYSRLVLVLTVLTISLRADDKASTTTTTTPPSSASTDSSCKGKVFSGICDVMLAMKKDIDESTRQTNLQFEEVKGMLENLKQQKEAKTLLEREVEVLSKIQAAGIRTVTKEMDKRVESFSEVLGNDMAETRQSLLVRTDNAIKFTNRNVFKLRDDIVSQFRKNKVIYKDGVRHLKAITGQNRNETNYVLGVQRLTIENEFNHEIGRVRSKFVNGISTVHREYKHNILQTNYALAYLEKHVDEYESNGHQNALWPEGGYCILANGDCPPGFESISGMMRGINVYSPNKTYIKEAVFGSSGIVCHGDYCGQQGYWIGDLYITTCCK